MTRRIVGIIPAAGYGTRLQPLSCSKEVYPVGGRPIMDYLVDRMLLGGASELRVVTRADKEDVVAHAAELGATTVLARPETVSDSILAGMAGLHGDDIVLIGFPDSLWEPEDGYERLVHVVDDGCDVALGLFRIDPADLTRSDVIVFGEGDAIAGIDIKPAAPRSEWIWGCAAAPAATVAGLGRAEWPGGYFDLLSREGRAVRGVRLSDSWIDVGTWEALRRMEPGAGADGLSR